MNIIDRMNRDCGGLISLRPELFIGFYCGVILKIQLMPAEMVFDDLHIALWLAVPAAPTTRRGPRT